ncbi:Chemotaxis protein CheX [Planctomyces bekefii]|uniref:Chemotaxis protein CheX n=1 Tax=Planctomyces bekefii TaxID=1653850 RepID=A0A5C6M4X1_9PLAN|nr:Chemotaxis protein CheX [Planctomyces bekefii]
MGKLLGEILLENGLVAPDALLKAIMTQLREIRSVAEVVYDSGFMSSSGLLKVLAEQQRCGCDFRTAAMNVGEWNNEIHHKVNGVLKKDRRPIGEILVEQGALTLDALMSTLDDLVQGSQEKSVERRNGEDTKTDKKVAKVFDSLLVDEFLNQYDLQFKAVYHRFAMGESPLVQNREERRSKFEEVYAAIAGIRAAAQFLGAPRSERVSEMLFTVLSALRSLGGDTDDQEFIDCLRIGGHVLDGLVEYLRSTHSEDLMDSDVNLQDLMGRLSTHYDRIIPLAKSKVA